jgi:hypothetical protein
VIQLINEYLWTYKNRASFPQRKCLLPEVQHAMRIIRLGTGIPSDIILVHSHPGRGIPCCKTGMGGIIPLDKINSGKRSRTQWVNTWTGVRALSRAFMRMSLKMSDMSGLLEFFLRSLNTLRYEP